ncbi:MAG: TetR/AcrR family transcriptional regulator [Microbacteriaceae bacterium]
MKTPEQKFARSYNSPVRAQRAAQAKERIISAARRRFVEDGYAGTSVAAIATDARVSRRTVYDTFSTKKDLLMALLGRMAPLSQLEFEVALAKAAGDAHAQLRIAIDFLVQYYQDGADVLGMVHAAADADPDIAELERTGESFRRMAQAPIVADWSQRGILRRGLHGDRAADILWSMTAPQVYRLFVIECEWTRSDFADWLCRSLEAQLLVRPEPSENTAGPQAR